MFMVMPAAVLFATVFSIGALTRHSEITAAKASGMSFYRFIAPILVGALIAAGARISSLGELVPITNAKRSDLLQENKVSRATSATTSCTRPSAGACTRSARCNAQRGARGD